MLKVILTLSALCLLQVSVAEQLVPLLAWSNSDALSAVERPSSVDVLLNEANIKQIDVAVLLKSSSLSFDDIAKYGGVYGEKNAPLSSLQDFLSSSVSSISMGLKGQIASELTSTLSFTMDVSPQFVTDIDLLENKDRQLFVVEMPQGNDEETFRAHDTLITKMVSMLDVQDVNYAMFYTSDHTVSQPSQEQTFNFDYVRSVDPLNVGKNSQNKTNTLCYPVWEDKECVSSSSKNNTCKACLLFCVDSTITYKQRFNNKTYIAATNGSDSFTMINGTCNTTRADDYPDFYNSSAVFGFIAFNATFNFVNATGNDLDPDKTINQILVYTFVKGECGRSNKTLRNITIGHCGFWTMNLFAGNSIQDLELYGQYHPELIYSPISVPLNNKKESDISYACGNNSLNRFVRYNNDNKTHDYTYFQHAILQVQPFSSLKVGATSQMLRFGSAYNCQGYFGTTSLMGVVAVLILLVILYLSSVFMFSIKSIDRFDDPRGEAINVENLH